MPGTSHTVQEGWPHQEGVDREWCEEEVPLLVAIHAHSGMRVHLLNYVVNVYL